ncbi:MAG: ABC transporter ATP-binding protein [Armatimonadetes bacterium]|nr:ABC transporter ATP-binding protein [Armatimonadota bacterium]
MNKPAIIETRNLVKRFRMDGQEVTAVAGVNLTIRAGELLGLMGPSGSGKTTLLNLLGTLDTPTEGAILLEGKDLARLTEPERDALRLRRIGFVFQSFNLIPTLTALENVLLPMEAARMPGPERRKRAHSLLKTVGLKGRLNHLPRQLSAGERQRVGVARSLANRPALILADEPTGNLDSRNTDEIVRLLQEVSQSHDTAVVIVTHNPEVTDHADRILRMRDGLIVEIR